MTRRFILRPRAERDIQSAYEWYESQRAGLGNEFLAALRERLEVVHGHPESSPVIYRGIRRAVVSRFPYFIFYVARPERVAVLAVLHHARNPAIWPRR
ncbi:MAG: type II toxin-antitoxin system RelE/ParE family toxin [Gammaproteobacteria bacterium]